MATLTGKLFSLPVSIREKTYMTKVLHTADVHLSSDRPERRDALDTVLEVAVSEEVDLLTIGGDLFDSEIDTDELRGDLRERFSDLPFSIIAIPGNHDEEAFREDLFFGEDFQPAVEEPFEVNNVTDDLRLVCLPYTTRPTEELLVEFKDREPFEGTDILLLHCSLEAPFADRDVGDEETQRYFPIGKETLAELDFDHYLAGHFHSAHRVELPNGGTFVYPGTPASITRGETGQRSVVLLDTESDRLDLPTIDTFHYDQCEFEVFPGEEEAIIERIEAWVTDRVGRNVEASITVTGHVDTDEQSFDVALDDASGSIPVDNQTTSVSTVLANPLYQSFEEELQARDLEDDTLQEAVRQRTGRVFSELERRGRFT